MKISDILPSKITFCKSAKIKKQGCTVDLLRLFLREIEKSFLYSCKNREDWKLDAKTDKDHVYLEMSCQANRRKEGEKADERV